MRRQLAAHVPPHNIQSDVAGCAAPLAQPCMLELPHMGSFKCLYGNGVVGKLQCNGCAACMQSCRMCIPAIHRARASPRKRRVHVGSVIVSMPQRSYCSLIQGAHLGAAGLLMQAAPWARHMACRLYCYDVVMECSSIE